VVTAFIRVEDLVVVFRGETVLEVGELELRGPGLYQILGPNGAGKTTLLRTIAGLVKPVKGKVIVSGVDVTGRPESAGRFIGYVPQHEHVSGYSYPITAYEMVVSALMLHRKRWPRVRTPSWAREAAINALKEVGLGENAWFKKVSELSGGQLQRVLIARALAHNPPILLMDEPLSAVDPRGRVGIARLLGRLAERKLVVVTSHDPSLLLEYTKGIVLLNRRVVAYGPPREVLTVEKLRKVYGGAVVVLEPHTHICDSHLPAGRG